MMLSKNKKPKKDLQSLTQQDTSVSFVYEVPPPTRLTSEAGAGATSDAKGSDLPLFPEASGEKEKSPGSFSPPKVLPSWFRFSQRRELKKQLIIRIVNDYAMPVKLLDGKTYAPTDEEVKDYGRLIRSAKLKDLLEIGHMIKAPLKLDVLDRLKSVDKKRHAVVTIFNDNDTTDTGVAHIDSRTFSRHGITYLIISNRGIKDPEFGMMHFYYYFNNPWPIEYHKNKLPEGSPDGKLLDDTIEFKILTALANIEMSKQINMILIMVIIELLLLAGILLVCLRGFKII